MVPEPMPTESIDSRDTTKPYFSPHDQSRRLTRIRTMKKFYFADMGNHVSQNP